MADSGVNAPRNGINTVKIHAGVSSSFAIVAGEGDPVLLEGRHHRLREGRRHVRQGRAHRLGVRDQRGGHGLVPGRTRSSPSTGRCATCRSTSPRARVQIRDFKKIADLGNTGVLWHQDRPGRQLRGHRLVRRAHLQVRPQDVGLRRDLRAGQRASEQWCSATASTATCERTRRSTAAAPRSSWEAILRARRRVPRREHIHRRRLVRRAYPQGRRDHVLPTTVACPSAARPASQPLPSTRARSSSSRREDAKIQQVDLTDPSYRGHRRHHVSGTQLVDGTVSSLLGCRSSQPPAPPRRPRAALRGPGDEVRAVPSWPPVAVTLRQITATPCCTTRAVAAAAVAGSAEVLQVDAMRRRLHQRRLARASSAANGRPRHLQQYYGCLEGLWVGESDGRGARRLLGDRLGKYFRRRPHQEHEDKTRRGRRHGACAAKGPWNRRRAEPVTDAFLDALTLPTRGRVAPAHRQRGYSSSRCGHLCIRRLVARGHQVACRVAPMCAVARLQYGARRSRRAPPRWATPIRIRAVRPDDHRRPAEHQLPARRRAHLRAIQGIGKERAALVLGGIPARPRRTTSSSSLLFVTVNASTASGRRRRTRSWRRTTRRASASARRRSTSRSATSRTTVARRNRRVRPDATRAAPPRPRCREWCPGRDDDYCPRSHCRCTCSPKRRRAGRGSARRRSHRSTPPAPEACSLRRRRPIVATVANCFDKCVFTKGCVV